MAAYLPRPSRSADRHRAPTGNRLRDPSRGNDPILRRNSRPTNWQYSCGLCQEDHAIRSCRTFQEMSPRQRYEAVERRGYCRNCLARSHLAPDCPSLTGCRQCDQRHHTMLHGAPQLNIAMFGVGPLEPAFNRATVFIPTVMVQVSEDCLDRWASVRGLLCQSAVVSRIASSLVKRLGLPTFHHQGRKFASFKLMSRHERNPVTLKVDALITNELPRRPYSDPILEDPVPDVGHHRLADVDPRCNTPLDIELGGDVYAAVRQEGTIPTTVGAVQASKTSLGYVLTGPTRSPAVQRNHA